MTADASAFARWLLLSGMLIIAVIVSACSTGPRQQTEVHAASFSIDRARIVFTASRGSSRELFLLNREGNSVSQQTREDGPDTSANSARVSPDGQQIAFQRRNGRDYEIMVMPVDGGQARNISRHAEYDVLPAWSPDSRRVAFMSTRGFELGGIGPFPGHVYIATLERSDDLEQVTVKPLTSSLGPSDWSRDGDSMLIARVQNGSSDIYLLDIDSGHEKRLTETLESESAAVFSHGGGWIAFHAESAGEAQIVVMKLDGTERRAITNGPGFRYYPRWSPDDQWILYTVSGDGEQYDLRAVHLHTGDIIEVVATPEDERDGDWLPGLASR